MDRDKISSQVIAILQEMTSDWDLDFGGGITEATRIMDDLEFESIDVVQLVGAIEEKFQKRGLPFEKLLMPDGQYAEEIVVAEIIDFLKESL